GHHVAVALQVPDHRGAVRPGPNDVRAAVAGDVADTRQLPVGADLSAGGNDGGAGHRGAVHVPDRNRVVDRIEPDDVGPAVHVDVGDAPDLPAGADRAAYRTGDDIGSVHQPGHRLAGGVEPDHVILAVVVEVAGAADLPIRTDG